MRLNRGKDKCVTSDPMISVTSLRRGLYCLQCQNEVAKAVLRLGAVNQGRFVTLNLSRSSASVRSRFYARCLFSKGKGANEAS